MLNQGIPVYKQQMQYKEQYLILPYVKTFCGFNKEKCRIGTNNHVATTNANRIDTLTRWPYSTNVKGLLPVMSKHVKHLRCKSRTTISLENNGDLRSLFMSQSKHFQEDIEISAQLAGKES